VTSVWLQSQDFIGLGFNIAGSMRDGIFVSQVHNRGPAVESGQFKIGMGEMYIQLHLCTIQQSLSLLTKE
jgi:hypothetical protein